MGIIQGIHHITGKANGLENYKNILTSGRWSNKDTKDAQIITLVGVYQKPFKNSKKLSEKSSREYTKGDSSYMRDIPHWMLEEPKGGVGKNFNHDKELWWCKEHRKGKGQWFRHSPEYHGKRTKTSTTTSNSSKKEYNIPTRKGEKKNINLTKYFKSGLMDIKYQSYVQAFLSQFNIDVQGNK